VSLIKNLEEAFKELRKGRFILIHDADDREGETDFIIAAEYVTPRSIKTMRKEGGGLIFLMTAYEVAEKLQLPYLSDLFHDVKKKYPVFEALIPNDIPYDNKSSFSVSLNHRGTFTGVTDRDRSLTIRRFAELTKEIEGLSNNEALKLLGREFRSPGHVPLCIASKNPLVDRFGHTELTISMLKMAGLTPVGAGCEIMGDDGKAMPKWEAKQYAEENGYIFLEGREIIDGWKLWLE